MTRDLLIIGSGGLAREAAVLARRIDPSGSKWGRIDFVTHDRDEIGKVLHAGEVRFLDSDLREIRETTDVVIGIGHPDLRRKVFERICGNPLLSFPNLVHPGVDLDQNLVEMGVGNMITHGVFISCDVKIGNFNLLNWNSTFGHDVRIGDFNVINPGSSISGGVTLQNCCLIGTGGRVLENLEISSEVKVGAGAVVTKSIPESGVYIGIPAKKR